LQGSVVLILSYAWRALYATFQGLAHPGDRFVEAGVYFPPEIIDPDLLLRQWDSMGV
jgi:hypothetical protein